MAVIYRSRNVCGCFSPTAVEGTYNYLSDAIYTVPAGAVSKLTFAALQNQSIPAGVSHSYLKINSSSMDLKGLWILSTKSKDTYIVYDSMSYESPIFFCDSTDTHIYLNEGDTLRIYFVANTSTTISNIINNYNLCFIEETTT